MPDSRKLSPVDVRSFIAFPLRHFVLPDHQQNRRKNVLSARKFALQGKAEYPVHGFVPSSASFLVYKKAIAARAMALYVL